MFNCLLTLTANQLITLWQPNASRRGDFVKVTSWASNEHQHEQRQKTLKSFANANMVIGGELVFSHWHIHLWEYRENRENIQWSVRNMSWCRGSKFRMARLARSHTKATADQVNTLQLKCTGPFIYYPLWTSLYNLIKSPVSIYDCEYTRH